jgi:hypothetical protein
MYGGNEGMRRGSKILLKEFGRIRSQQGSEEAQSKKRSLQSEFSTGWRRLSGWQK